MSAANHLLNAVASIAIRVWPPIEAKRRVDAIGALLKPLGPEQARRAARQLRGGTCLSRALAVASRLPGSEVVIGANGGRQPFRAHAWVESRGEPIGPAEPVEELTRLK